MAHRIVHPEEYDRRKRAVFDALAAVAGAGRRPLWVVPLSPFGWPETRARVDAAQARAKKPGRTALGRWLKRLLLTGQYNWARRHFARNPGDMAVAWNGLTGGRMVFLSAARDAGAPVLHAELAPLPGCITLDPAGVNAEGSVPRDPAFFRGQPAGQDWRALRDQMRARAPRRGDVRQIDRPVGETPFLFCPLQVPDDSQVRLFAGWCGGFEGFLTALAAAAAHLPPGWHLRIKEHPSARTGAGDLLAPLVAGGRAVIDNETDSLMQMAASRGVVTLNSSMGLQAFFHDLPVVVLGRALYDLPGLVVRCDSQAELDAAFAGAGALAFDADLRDRFMTWLADRYYPRFSMAEGGAGFDRAAFAAKLEQAVQSVRSGANR